MTGKEKFEDHKIIDGTDSVNWKLLCPICKHDFVVQSDMMDCVNPEDCQAEFLEKN